MPRLAPDSELKSIEEIVRARPGATSPEIAAALPVPVKLRTLQYRLKRLVDDGRLVREGDDRWARYRMPDANGATSRPGQVEDEAVPLSSDAQSIRAHLDRPLTGRTPVGYRREFLTAYRPGETFYLSEAERARLAETGTRPVTGQDPAGTYARHILNRLLIDLSWNSSRLEGNTYSLLETKRLIEFGQHAQGRDQLEAQMILNHKDAVEFLVGNAADIGFDRYTLLNLHSILANNLLPDSRAAGRLRHLAVGIDGSVYHPPEGPQFIEESFDLLLATARAIRDPYEQSLFVMVQLPYLQPFDDVNKRVSRMAANIPFIKANLSPLSFTDLPRRLYTHAMLGVYELNRIELLRDVFVWSYERSATRYAAVRQSLGEPDPFRLRYRDALRTLVSAVVREGLDRRAAIIHIDAWTTAHIAEPDRATFREVVETELLGLHEGNFARYAIRPSEFSAWQRVWTPTA